MPKGPESAGRFELPPQSRLVEVVDEGSLAVDLDDREPLAVGGLELGDARDLDFLVLHALVVQDYAGAVTEVTARGGVEDDSAQG